MSVIDDNGKWWNIFVVAVITDDINTNYIASSVSSIKPVQRSWHLIILSQTSIVEFIEGNGSGTNVLYDLTKGCIIIICLEFYMCEGSYKAFPYSKLNYFQNIKSFIINTFVHSSMKF